MWIHVSQFMKSNYEDENDVRINDDVLSTASSREEKERKMRHIGGGLR